MTMTRFRLRPPAPERQRGAAAIEFALVFVLFFMVLYGAIAYGVVFAIKHSLTQGAAEGARAALKDVGGLPERIALAQTTATNAVSWLGTGAPAPIVTSGPCEATSYTCIKVAFTYDYATSPIVPPIPSLGIVLPDTLVSQATVQLDAID
jgi:Flp pilus assembly protein TadG